MKTQAKARMLAVFFSMLIILMPVSFAQTANPAGPSTGERLAEKAKTVVKTDIGGQLEEIKTSFTESIENPPEFPESLIGQDIAINVRHYEPRVIPTNLIESQGAIIYALLEGYRTNPAITIADISKVDVKIAKVTTEPVGKPVSIGAVRHYKPKAEELRFDNLGYLAIPIGRIPREADVPDSIILDLNARIYFDVGSGLGFGPQEDVLEREALEQWKMNRDEHKFFFGYLRATEVNDKGASFAIYDDALNEVATTPLIAPGQSSSGMSATSSRFGGFGKVFDRFKINVNEIRGRNDRVTLYVIKDGIAELKKLSKGQSLFAGSNWYISEIYVSPDGRARWVEINNRKKNDPRRIDITSLTPVEEKKVQGEKEATKPDGNVAEWNSIKSEVATLEAQPVRDYKLIIEKLTEFSKKSPGSTIAREAMEIVQKIQTYHTNKLGEIEYLLNSDPKNKGLGDERVKLTNTIQGINTLFESYRKLIATGQPSYTKPVDSPTTAQQAFESAVSTYLSLADDYPQSEEAPKALAQAGLIQWAYLKNPYLAAELFNRLLTNYKDEDLKRSGIPKNTIERQKNAVEMLSKMQTRLHEWILDLPDIDNTFTTVSVVSIEKPLTGQLASRAYMSINGAEQSFTEGQMFIANDDKDSLTYKIERINDNGVEFSYKYPQDQDWIRPTYSVAGRVGVSTRLQLGENILPLTRDGKTQLRVVLRRTDLQREVSVTITPEAEKAFTNAAFKVRIGIEKRPFGVPLFSESIDEELAKVEKLLAKLDKIIESATKIHEYWKKLCFITYGIITVKNLLFGGSAAIARSKVNDIYRDKYTKKELPGCENSRNYEACIFSIQQTYNADIERAQTILKSIKDESYKNDGYADLGENWLDDRRDLEFYKKWYESKPDEGAAMKYYSASLRLENQKLGRDIANQFHTENQAFKSYKDLKADPNVQKEVEQIINERPVMREKLEKEYKGEYELVYNEYRNEIFEIYKDKKLNEGLGDKAGKLKGGLKSERSADAEIIDRARRLMQPRTSNAKQVSLTSVSAKTITEGTVSKTSYYLSLPDQEVPLGLNFPKIGDAVPYEGVTYKFVEKNEDVPQHVPRLSLVQGTRAAGKAEFLSVDAYHYVQVKYSQSGAVENMHLFKRSEPNSMMGYESDVRIGELDSTITSYKKDDPVLGDRLTKSKDCISKANKKLVGNRYKTGDVNVVECAQGLGRYSVDASIRGTEASCVDFMDPTECKILFNACDPVICPASRCDLGGVWRVDDVVQTGIIGSVALCLPNIEQGVVMPVCITGIIAGLQNIRSILAGYKQCLTTAKVEGRSVGICDRIRSVGICEMMWREAMAIMNLKGSIINFVAKQLGGATYGGGEYSSFKQSFDNSIGSLEYFTQSYAKNTFAQYAGGTLPDLGAEVCKAAIFGKAPGLGNFFGEVMKPESPPQFTAFFDERSQTDVTGKSLSIYSVFYHMYAGENQDITYSVWLQTRGIAGEEAMPPKYVVNSRFLPRGKFASENLIAQNIPSGYKEICIVVTSDIYGQQGPVCGFGKASTNFFANWVEEKLAESQLKTQVTTEEECTPQTGRLTTLSYQDASLSKALGQTPRAVVGAYSTGLTSTGIIRKCSSFDPGIGSEKGAWTPVGTCGKDERGRDLGTCWLYKPAAMELIKNTDTLKEINQSLDALAREVIKDTSIPGLEIMKGSEILSEQNAASNLVNSADKSNTAPISGAIKAYDRILKSAFITPENAAKTLFEKGRAYERLGFLMNAKVAEAAGGGLGKTPLVPPVSGECFVAFIAKDGIDRLPLTEFNINQVPANMYAVVQKVLPESPRCTSISPTTWNLRLMSGTNELKAINGYRTGDAYRFIWYSQTIQNMIGNDLYFIAKDDNGNEVVSDSVRVIKSSAFAIQPAPTVNVPLPVAQQATCFKTIITSDREGRQELTSISSEAGEVYLHVVPVRGCSFPDAEWRFQMIFIDDENHQTDVGPGGVYILKQLDPLRVLFTSSSTPNRQELLAKSSYFKFSIKRTVSGREEDAFVTLPIVRGSTSATPIRAQQTGAVQPSTTGMPQVTTTAGEEPRQCYTLSVTGLDVSNKRVNLRATHDQALCQLRSDYDYYVKTFLFVRGTSQPEEFGKRYDLDKNDFIRTHTADISLVLTDENVQKLRPTDVVRFNLIRKMVGPYWWNNFESWISGRPMAEPIATFEYIVP